MLSRLPQPRTLFAPLIAGLVLLVCEALHVPAAAYAVTPLRWAGACGELATLAASFLVVPFAVISVMALVESTLADNRQLRWLRSVSHGTASALATWHSYDVLTAYEPFAEHMPFKFLYGFFFGWMWLCPMTLGWKTAPTTRNGVRIALKWGPGALSAAAGLGLHTANYIFFKNLYPTLHLAMLEIAFCLWGIGLVLLVTRLPSGFFLQTRKRTGIVLVLATLLAAPPIGGLSGLGANILPYVRAHTTLGQSWVAFSRIEKEKNSPPTRLKEDPKAVQRFEALHHLPDLPEESKLEDYNILLIMAEAVRYDRTSLADPALETTPNLVDFVKEGAFTFTRAHSPSSGTLHSISALFSMTYPSAVHLETWKKSWHGQLLQKNVTVAEVLSQAGYKTFWIGHNHKKGFEKVILGLDQGFGKKQLIPTPTKGKSARNVDNRIRLRVERKLSKLSQTDTRFFGWVFFSSPHSPYLSHGMDWPDESSHDRYLQEIHEFDRQLGFVLRTLRKKKLLKNTIVVITSDHGEEFREHGGRYHKSTVYNEVTHVPLVIWIPGVKGETVRSLTSLIYLFPWLFLRADEQIRDAAVERIAKEIGPMLRATGGAVITELLGHNRSMSALVYRQYKLIHDALTHVTEVYDLDADPGEENDLGFELPVEAQKLTPFIDAYQKVQRANRHHLLLPKKKRREVKKKDALEPGESPSPPPPSAK